MNASDNPRPRVHLFKNSNMHVRFNQQFILALNVEHGRLRGWLNSKAEAAEELQEPMAAAFFGTNHRLAVSNPGRLLTGK